MRKERGFTLMELVLVVAIIAVLAAIFIPAFIKPVNPDSEAKANEYKLINNAMEKLLENEDLATNDMSIFPSAEHPLYPEYLEQRYTESKYWLGRTVFQK